MLSKNYILMNPSYFESGITENRKPSIIFIVTLTVLSIFLNFQKNIFGYNLSPSDIAAVILFFLLLNSSLLKIPKYIFIFFIYLSTITIFMGYYVSPYKFTYIGNVSTVLNDYIKLLASFLYFILGYNLFKNFNITLIYKWYSITAVFIGLFGIIVVFLNINVGNKEFFFEASRYIGLLSDPNYYSVIMCTSLVYFLRDNSQRMIVRIISYIIIFLSIAISGSKTGMVIFVVYSFVTFSLKIFSIKRKEQLLKNIVILLSIIISIPMFIPIIKKFFEELAIRHSAFNRVLVLFYDFNSAISDSGSSRDNTWQAGIEIIKQSPITGVGIGAYSNVRQALEGSRGLAHNTYLQITAEWGIPLSIILFSFLFYIVGKHIFCHYKFGIDSIIVRDILIILLIGSISLSLNNARMFWFFTGILFSSTILGMRSINSRIGYLNKMKSKKEYFY